MFDYTFVYQFYKNNYPYSNNKDIFEKAKSKFNKFTHVGQITYLHVDDLGIHLTYSCNLQLDKPGSAIARYSRYILNDYPITTTLLTHTRPSHLLKSA